MPRPRIRDQTLMEKIAKKTGKPISAVNGMVSRKADNLSISAQAALAVLAKEHKIGTSNYYGRLDPTKQAEVRNSLPGLFVQGGIRNVGERARIRRAGKSRISAKASLKHVIEYLIQDAVLRARCEDILLASTNFDRSINQATQVLEDRIRKKAQPTQRLSGEHLVGFAFNEDASKTALRVASNDSDDQRGFTQILRGMVPAFRNKTHHHIITVSREEAMCVCGFIDVLLRVVDGSTKVR
jgi:hypothetical protein